MADREGAAAVAGTHAVASVDFGPHVSRPGTNEGGDDGKLVVQNITTHATVWSRVVSHGQRISCLQDVRRAWPHLSDTYVLNGGNRCATIAGLSFVSALGLPIPAPLSTVSLWRR